MSGKREYSVSGGFGVLLAILLFMDEQNIVPWALLACFIHEMGHVLAIHMLGGSVQSFRLSVIGAEIVPTRNRLFSYQEELVIAASGPLISCIAAIMGAYFAGGYHYEKTFLFCGLNLVAGLFNLIPEGPLDGGRMLKILLFKRYSLQKGEQIYQCITALFSISLLSLGIFHVFKLGGNLTLILTALWLLAGVRRNHA